jgi:hypothetical protein
MNYVASTRNNSSNTDSKSSRVSSLKDFYESLSNQKNSSVQIQKPIRKITNLLSQDKPNTENKTTLTSKKSNLSANSFNHSTKNLKKLKSKRLVYSRGIRSKSNASKNSKLKNRYNSNNRLRMDSKANKQKSKTSKIDSKLKNSKENSKAGTKNALLSCFIPYFMRKRKQKQEIISENEAAEPIESPHSKLSPELMVEVGQNDAISAEIQSNKEFSHEIIELDSSREQKSSENKTLKKNTEHLSTSLIETKSEAMQKTQTDFSLNLFKVLKLLLTAKCYSVLLTEDQNSKDFDKLRFIFSELERIGLKSLANLDQSYLKNAESNHFRTPELSIVLSHFHVN